MAALNEAYTMVGLGETLWQSVPEARGWAEAELEVGDDWIALALREGALDAEGQYFWEPPDEVDRLLLEGTYDLIYALEPAAAKRYRLTAGGRILIGRKLTARI